MPRALEAPREDRTLVHWLRRRVPDWQRLGDLLSEQRDRASESYAEVIELVDRFRSLGRDLSLARALLPGSALCRELENLFLKAHEAVFRRPTQLKAQLIELFRDEVPRVFHDMSATIWITVPLLFNVPKRLLSVPVVRVISARLRNAPPVRLSIVPERQSNGLRLMKSPAPPSVEVSRTAPTSKVTSAIPAALTVAPVKSKVPRPLNEVVPTIVWVPEENCRNAASAMM